MRAIGRQGTHKQSEARGPLQSSRGSGSWSGHTASQVGFECDTNTRTGFRSRACEKEGGTHRHPVQADTQQAHALRSCMPSLPAFTQARLRVPTDANTPTLTPLCPPFLAPAPRTYCTHLVLPAPPRPTPTLYCLFFSFSMMSCSSGSTSARGEFNTLGHCVYMCMCVCVGGGGGDTQQDRQQDTEAQLVRLQAGDRCADNDC